LEHKRTMMVVFYFYLKCIKNNNDVVVSKTSQELSLSFFHKLKLTTCPIFIGRLQGGRVTYHPMQEFLP